MSAISKRLVLLAGVLVMGAASANAAPRRAVVLVPHVGLHRTWAYDPFWGPWYPASPYAYAYPGAVDHDSRIRTSVTPKDTEVFVDGYYAGRADDFDGAFSSLHVVPGGHSIALHLDGFRTVTQNVYVRPGSTFKVNTSMARVGAGETSAPVPAPGPPSD